jgi:hypothetical protein
VNLGRGGPKVLKIKLVQGGPLGSSPLRSNSGGRLDCVRRRVGKQLQEARNLTENRHGDSRKKGQLTISQCKMKKGDDVADDDDDAVRTTLTQDRVTATLCTEELFLRTQYI